MNRILVTCAAALLPFCSFAGDAAFETFETGDLRVTTAMAGATAPGARAGAGYFVIENDGTSGDRLVSVKADFPKVMIHQTVMEDGVAKMMMQDGVDIPAGGEAILEPGATHVMFMGLSEPLEAGASLEATLVFESAGELPVTFTIMPITEIASVMKERAAQ